MRVEKRSEIDSLTGFRALAAGMVFLYHYAPKNYFFVFEYGYLGVNFFFTLSGFLFTVIYFDRFAQRNQCIKEYFIKRAARVYPLYFTLLIVMIFRRATWSDGEWVNIITHFTLTHAYFGDFLFAYISPSWTLCVEELFYSVLPLCFFWFAMLTRTNSLKDVKINQIFLYLLIISLGLFLLGYFLYIQPFKSYGFFQTKWNLIHYTLFGRFWDFSIGIISAVYVTKNRESKILKNSGLSTIIGVLSGIIFLILAYYVHLYGVPRVLDENNPNVPNIIAEYVAPVCASLLIISLSGDSIWNKMFSNKFIVYLGKISFSLYLIQYLELPKPILEEYAQLIDFIMHTFGKENKLAGGILLYIAMSLAAALLYEGIEKPVQMYVRGRIVLNKGSYNENRHHVLPDIRR